MGDDRFRKGQARFSAKELTDAKILAEPDDLEISEALPQVKISSAFVSNVPARE
jgi:hypothetical protein